MKWRTREMFFTRPPFFRTDREPLTSANSFIVELFVGWEGLEDLGTEKQGETVEQTDYNNPMNL
jgi:hypothetical protein